MEQQWWKNAIGYQIYPRSFKDSNGDGIGDLQGIIEKLPYLKDLGIDFIWLNPIYQSPNVDNGYDISDYQAIQEEYGSMADFEELLSKAHEMGLKVILDLVVNHTSDQHPWFLEAKKSKDNPYRDYYHWQDASEQKLPNNWQSFFGGSTWTYDEVTNQAFFHVFAPQQPDLNWKNPKVREEIYRMIQWWLDLGIDGFRLDAISHIQKAAWQTKIKDNPWAPFMNVAGIDAYMQDLKKIFGEYPIMTVGEASGVTSKKAVGWTNADGYLDMIFELEHNVREGEPGKERINLLGFKKVLARWQKHLENDGWNALYIENHDNPRFNTILGNETAKSAKALAVMYLLLKGTPFIYQGQEIGMTNFPFTSIEQVDAKDMHRYYQSLLAEGLSESKALAITTRWARDNSRTPMQWDESENAGFTTGTPWLAVNPNAATINVEAEGTTDSVLAFYKQLIAYRKAEPIFTEGNFDLLLANDPDIFAYQRQFQGKTIVVLVNASEKTRRIELPKRLLAFQWELTLANGNPTKLAQRMTLAPYDAFVFETKQTE